MEWCCCLASLTKWWSIMVRSPGLDFEPLMTTSCLSCHVIWLPTPTWASLDKSHITVSHHHVHGVLVSFAFKPLSPVKWHKSSSWCHHLGLKYCATTIFFFGGWQSPQGDMFSVDVLPELASLLLMSYCFLQKIADGGVSAIIMLDFDDGT